MNLDAETDDTLVLTPVPGALTKPCKAFGHVDRNKQGKCRPCQVISARKHCYGITQDL